MRRFISSVRMGLRRLLTAQVPIRIPHLGKVLACLSILGVAGLGYVFGAAVMFFQLPSSEFLYQAFTGTKAWQERGKPELNPFNPPEDEVRVRDFLREINREEGVTVLLTTHDMSDVEQLCSRVLIIDHGTLLYDGTLDEIRDRLGTERTLVIDLAEDVSGQVQVRGATEVRADGPRRWLQFNRLETTAAELIAEVAGRYPLRDLTIEEPAIETIVRRIYEYGLQPTQASSVPS